MKYKITLDNKTYEVEVEKGEAALLAEYEAALPVAVPAVVNENASAPEVEAKKEATPSSSSDNIIVAPLPGAVLDVMVDVGDTVNNGDVVAIIEAMKMENEVIAVISGKVTQVIVKKGTTVNTGDHLFILG